MLEKSFSVLTYLRKPKFYKKGDPFQIYLKVTVDGSAVEISAKRTWFPDRWDSRQERATGLKEDAKSLNRFLDIMTNKVHDARRNLIDDDKEVTAVAIKNCLMGIDERKMLLQIFREHNEGIKAQVPFEYSLWTYLNEPCCILKDS